MAPPERGVVDDLKVALHASMPVAMGYVPLGVALGAFVVSLGLPWWVAPASALLVYAGSMEFLLASLVTGTPSLLTVATAALAINFRHVFYPLAYPTELLVKPWQKVVGAWQLTDEMYALMSVGQRPQTTRELLMLSGIIQGWWVSGAALGTAVGQLVPKSFVGFNFAMTALFIALTLDFFISSRQWRVAVWSGVAVLAGIVLPGPFLAWALGVFMVCCVVAVMREEP